MSSISAGTTSTTTLVHSGDTTGSLVFKTNDTGSGGTTAVTIDTSQKVGIGTASPSALLHVSSTSAETLRFQSTSSAPYQTFYNSSANRAGYMEWNTSALKIDAESGASSTMAFLTANNERMRISSTGAVSIGTTSTYNSSNLSVNGRIASTTPFFSGGNGGSFWQSGSDGISGTPSYIVYNGNGSGVFLAWGNTSWSANSDERIKTDLTPIENAIQKVSTLRTVTGRYKIDKEGTSRLFLIAQDVQKVFPEAISIQNDTQGTLGLAYTDLIPVLVAAIKEQQALITAQAETINALTARVVALESK